MNERPSGIMPESVSTVAQSVDTLMYWIIGVSAFFFVLIVVMMTVFVIRYRRRSEDDTTPAIERNNALEIFWSVVPLVVLILFALFGFLAFLNMRTPPNRSMQVYVTAKRWIWNFEYATGIQTTNELVVPVGQPVKLIMSSEDVIHSFFVPAFRIKQDVLPNRHTTVWFEATAPGDYVIFCTEYCGTGHSDMTGVVRVVAADEFREWADAGGMDPNAENLPMAEFGRALYRSKACHTCHSLDGSPGIGPTFQGLFGREETMNDGSTVVVDEEYVRESITHPASRVVSGYAPVMPAYPTLTDRQINALIEYLRDPSAAQ